MFAWILSSSVLILVVIILRYALKGKISLRLQYAMWGLVLLRLLLPGSLFPSSWSVMTAVESSKGYEEVTDVLQATQVYSDIIRDSELTPEEAKEIGNGTLSRYEGYSVESGNSHLKTYSFKDSLSNVIPRLLKPVWIAGMSILIICFLCSNVLFQIRLKRSRREFETDQIICNVPVYITDEIETPCLFGLFYPAIYVTPEVVENDVVLNHVLTHETTHYLHRDQIWSFLRCVCLILHWYNPLVWLAAELSRRDGELACDESTIEYLGESKRIEYGRTLIDLTCMKKGKLLTTATTMTGNAKSLKERIKLIAKKPKMALYTLITVLVIAAVAVLCTFTGSAKDVPWHWARTLSDEDVTRVEIWSMNGSEHLTAEETDELVDVIRRLNRLNFKENSQLAGSTPEYGITLICGEDRYGISEVGKSRAEISYGGKLWWINDKKLAEYIFTLSEERLDEIYADPVVDTPRTDEEAPDLTENSIEMILHNVYVQTAQSTGVSVKVIAHMQKNEVSPSGFELVGIEIPAIVDQTGYALVRMRNYSPEIQNITYDSEKQSAQIRFLFYFKGDVGSLNWSKCEATLTINLKQKTNGATILTADEVAKVNDRIAMYVDDGAGGLMMNPLACFFTSYYNQPDLLDLNNFLAYFPSGEYATEEEFGALKKLDGFPFLTETSLNNMPVPTHKIKVSKVNEVLQRYMGIKVSDLKDTTLSSGEVFYLKEYDSYYNFTSDAIGVGFQCIYGEKSGEYLKLYSTSSVINLLGSGNEYKIQSYLPTDLLQTS